MTAQTRIIKHNQDHLAHLALLYAIWGDEVRSEALRTMMCRTSQENKEDQQSLQAQAIIV